MSLNSRQERFYLEIVSGKSGQRVAADAGYSSSLSIYNSPRLLTKAKIISRIAELQKEASCEKITTIMLRKERLKELTMEDNPGRYDF